MLGFLPGRTLNEARVEHLEHARKGRRTRATRSTLQDLPGSNQAMPSALTHEDPEAAPVTKVVPQIPLEEDHARLRVHLLSRVDDSKPDRAWSLGAHVTRGHATS